MRIHASLPGTALKNKKKNPPLYYLKKSPNIVFRIYIAAFLRRIAQSSLLNNLLSREIFAPLHDPCVVIIIA